MGITEVPTEITLPAAETADDTICVAVASVFEEEDEEEEEVDDEEAGIIQRELDKAYPVEQA